MVVHVLGRAGGHDLEHGVPAGGGIGHNDGATVAAVVAEIPPGRGSGEGAVLDHLAVAHADLAHAHIIDETFAAIEHAEDELVEARRIARAGEGRASAGVGNTRPRCFGGFVARDPRLGHRVVHAGVAQLQAAAAAVGALVPAPAVEVVDLARRVAARVFQPHGVAAVGERTGGRAGDGDAGEFREQCRGIFRDDEVAVGGDLRARREVVAQPAAQLPAGEQHGRRGAVVQLHPFLWRWHGARREVGRRMVEHDFVDRDARVQREGVRGPRCRCVGHEPRAAAAAGLGRILHHHAVADGAVGRGEEELLPIERAEAERRLVEREQRTGGEIRRADRERLPRRRAHLPAAE